MTTDERIHRWEEHRRMLEMPYGKGLSDDNFTYDSNRLIVIRKCHHWGTPAHARHEIYYIIKIDGCGYHLFRDYYSPCRGEVYPSLGLGRTKIKYTSNVEKELDEISKHSNPIWDCESVSVLKAFHKNEYELFLRMFELRIASVTQEY